MAKPASGGGDARFPYRLAAREALANLAASPVRAVVCFGVQALLGALLVAGTTLEVGQIVTDYDALTAAGANMFVAQRVDGGGIDAARCDSLLGRPGVIGAGGLVSSERVTAKVDPGVSFDLMRASPGYAALVWPDLDRSVGAPVVGARVADKLGVFDSGSVAYVARDGSQDLAEVVSAPGAARIGELGNSMVVPVAPVNRLTQCWVEAAPGARASVEELLVGWFDEPTRVLVAPAVLAAAPGSGPADRLDRRLSYWAPLAVVGATGVFQAVLWLGRRADLGLYGLLGLRGGRLAVMVVTDWAFTVLAPFCAGVMAAAVVMAGRLEGLTLELAAWDCLRAAALLALAPLAVLALATMVKPFDAIRGR
ncbi:MAG: hypothetical protein LBS27_02250 [Bifidobacteriaceae bacterium]|nr:hypothetical protein [Bifidobacteriaceae bacterium]